MKTPRPAQASAAFRAVLCSSFPVTWRKRLATVRLHVSATDRCKPKPAASPNALFRSAGAARRCHRGGVMRPPSKNVRSLRRVIRRVSRRLTRFLPRSRMTMSLNPFNKPSGVSRPADFEAPEPRPLSVTRGEWLPVVATGTLALAARLGSGVFVAGWRPRLTLSSNVAEDEYALKFGPVALQDSSAALVNPPRPVKDLVLYEYEASPFARKVREAMAILDLTVGVLPTFIGMCGIRDSLVHSAVGDPEAVPWRTPRLRKGARAERRQDDGIFSYPLFVTTKKRSVASHCRPGAFPRGPKHGGEHVRVGRHHQLPLRYVWTGTGPERGWHPAGPLAVQSAAYAAAARGFAGSRMLPNARPDNMNMKPIELWGYEASPFVRPVREKLSGELRYQICADRFPPLTLARCACQSLASRTVL
eukprot:scaffold735_cov255-Pinguiococcus_pyrenoidosus.AAC.25